MVWFFNMLPFLSLFFSQLYRIHVVLSIMFIGLHILKHLTLYKVSKKQLIQAFSYISNYVLDWGNYDCVKL